MFKVVVIDDEPIIRRGLIHIVQWLKHGCEICGEASNGKLGCELIERVRPDIIFTDIRMPDMDGLSMIRQIKSFVPHSKVIILSGYRDFEYAQEAIRLGAYIFLLKPSKIEDVDAAVSKAVEELHASKVKREEIEQFQKRFAENLPVLREKLLYDVFFGLATDMDDVMEKMRIYHMTIGPFILLLLEVEGNGSANDLSKYDQQLYMYGVVNTAMDVFGESYQVFSIPFDHHQIAFLVQAKDGCSVPEFSDVVKNAGYLQELTDTCFGIQISIAVSEPGDGIKELSTAHKQCIQAIEHKFYLGNGSIILYRDMHKFYRVYDDSELEKLISYLMESIKTGNVEKTGELLKETASVLKQSSHLDHIIIRNYYWNIISAINSIKINLKEAEKMDVIEDTRDVSGLFAMIQQCDNIDDLNAVLVEAASRTAEKVNRFNNNSMKLLLRRAIQYIEENYANPITLGEVADAVYVSSYYLSRIFKLESGRNFVDYLNETRINRAKELLKDMRLKTYEVAQMVGIPDAHYFSKIFKKYTDKTPTDYKDSV